MRPNRKCRRARQFAGDFFIGLAVFLAVMALAVLDTRTAKSAPTFATGAEAVARAGEPSHSRVGTGTLFLRKSGQEQDTALSPAPRIDTNVDISVEGPVARTAVTQRFRNTGDHWVEGVYAFPLPDSAAVDTLAMRIGKRTVQGQIAPSQDALRFHSAARNAGRMAGVTAGQRPATFTTSIANIGPGEEIAISVEYQQTLHRDGDTYSLRFPLAVKHRTQHRALHPATFGVRTETPGPGVRAADPAANPVSLQVRLDSGFKLGAVTSDTHEIVLRRTGEKSAILALARTGVPADRDFELSWRYEAPEAPAVAAFRQTIDGNAYVLAMLAPPGDEAAPEPLPREVIFVVDTSESMAGTAIRQARESLARALKRLGPGDRFNIIGFDDRPDVLFEQAQPATQGNIATGENFVAQLKAQGGTEMLSALKTALRDPAATDGGRIRQVVLVTDGAVSNESDFLSHLAAQRGRSRLFIAGVGSAPNAFLMRRAAEIGRGSYVHIPTERQVLSRMNELYERLERPVLTGLKVEWASGVRADAWPDPLPDLYAGEPLLLAGQLSALKGHLTITGKAGGQPWKQTLALASADTGSGIGRFWARNKIASIEARRYTGQPESDIAQAIEAVALEHTLVSRMTSLVPLDTTPSRPEDQQLASEDLPFDLPAGWVFDGIFDASAPERAVSSGKPLHTAALAKGTAGKRMTDKRKGLPGAALDTSIAGERVSDSAERQEIALKPGLSGPGGGGAPGASAGPGQAWTLTIMALAFGFMIALTLGLWRHLHHAVMQPRDRDSFN